MTKADAELFYSNEQRRFRRLEVSLPVWLAEEGDLTAGGVPAWSLGYTRDISIGGTKVIVPRGEEERWKAISERGTACLLRFDAPGIADTEFVSGRVKRAAYDAEAGHFWLGVQYDDGAEAGKAEVMRAGLRTVRSRQRWQWLLAFSMVVLMFAVVFINKLNGDVARQQQEVARLSKQLDNEQKTLTRLLKPTLVGTRAQGIDAAFETKQIDSRIRQLKANMARLNNPNNREAAELERVRKRASDGIVVSQDSGAGANINLGVALPYGYAWPQVTGDLEELLGRRVPTVVVFRDFKSSFPIEDAREARLRAKTLQVTWEPWHFSNQTAIKLKDITAGKHDKYIDRWATEAKAFGNELWVRWGHEFNGNWYPWSVSANGQNASVYIAAFRHMRTRFNKVGAFNVRWIWCMNAENVPEAPWNDPLRAYPGDSFVDMISIDGYNFGNTLSHSRWLSFDEIFDEPYSRIIKKWPNKPLMIGEISCATVGGDKAAWIRDMDRSLRGKYRRIQGLVWFDAQKEADWRMASSPATLSASRAVWQQRYYRRGEP